MRKDSLNIVVVGHVDHGKSTLIGRLLFDTESLPREEIERVKKASKEKGKDFEYAYLLDAFEEEQKQGITIDITKLQFKSRVRDYVIIDAPGHKEFLKNMISGASQGDAAIILIDCNEGIKEQSRRHGFILSLLGIKKIFVAANKMDLINYDEKIFNSVVKEFSVFLESIGVEATEYIPVAAINGENLINRSENLSWYKGPTIIEAMDNLEINNSLIEKEFRLPIQDVYKFDSRRIIAGRIESGNLKVGDEIVIYPSLKESKVLSLEYFGNGKGKNQGEEGESIGITIADEFFNKRGEIIIKKQSENKPKITKEFKASLFWMGNNSLVEGREYKLKLATEEVLVKIKKVNKVLDTSSLENKSNKGIIEKNQVGEVIIESKELLVLDEFSKIANTGRFVLVDGYDVAGGGIIIGSEEEISSKEITVIRESLVTKELREINNKKNKVIWLRGLPGSGKNEIAINLEKKIFENNKKACYLSEGTLNSFESKEIKFNEKDNVEKDLEIVKFAKILLESDIIPIITNVFIKEEDRIKAREILGENNYIEIFVDAEKDVCLARSNNNNLAKEYYYEEGVGLISSLKIKDNNFDVIEKTECIYQEIKNKLEFF